MLEVGDRRVADVIRKSSVIARARQAQQCSVALDSPQQGPDLCMPTISTSRYGHLKYSISAAELVALGATTTFDFPLDSLPPGAVIYSTMIKSAGVINAGTTGTAQFKFNGTLIGAAVDIKTITGLVNNTIANGSLSAANPLVMTVTTTNAFSTLTTGGPIEGVLNYSVLAP